MKDASFAFLESLLKASGPSGREGPVQAVFESRVRDVADEIVRLPHGSVAAIKNPGGSPRLVVTGHADEIGLVVHHIDDKGYLYFRGVGGIDLVTLPGTRVDVHAGDECIEGVIGRKPTHLQADDERTKVGKISTLYIDIGCASKDEAAARVRPGDTVTFKAGVIRLGADRVASKSIDNRAGIYCAAEAFLRLADAAPKACVIALSTVCEEIGGEGALTAAFDLEPDLAIVVDVTFASDQPDVSTSDICEVELGKGPVLTRGPRLNESVVNLLEAAAKRAKVGVQHEVIANRTGTDGDLFYRSRGGVPIAVVGVPLRYMHTPSEVASLADLDSTAKLLAALATSLKPDTSFDPFATRSAPPPPAKKSKKKARSSDGETS